jgi:hypothetical protein
MNLNFFSLFEKIHRFTVRAFAISGENYFLIKGDKEIESSISS